MVEKKPKPLADSDPLSDCIKDIDRQIHALQKQLTMSKNKLRLELRKVAPEIEQVTKNFKKQQLLVLLRHYPTAQAIAAASVDELRALRYGKRQWRLPISFIHEMQTLAKDSIAYKTTPGAGLVVQALVKQIVFNQKAIALLRKQIIQIYNRVNEGQSLLTTIAGIGIETAITLEAYIGDANRFPNAKAIVAYFGLNPTIYHSGIKTRNASRLQKKGCAIVRHKLFMAALNIVCHKTDPFYSFYQRLVDRGKPKLVALCATMHKLLIVIYNILKNQKPFDPNYSKSHNST